ncbi:copper resistance CopC family protein [Halalkalibacter krulwichiae]|uniref:CopC domain-containing protein n=1 Tax=Halalkalibacter krulwichiae TaxID=199441 RepID=A0A1X9MFF5_9BACI|nr:copper resistance protein CopC [Halalkalibacter krulwichiae]ARK30833.1 hypothetical protein BkAM31D_13835 [Halalkalibacter krulwichiae]
MKKVVLIFLLIFLLLLPIQVGAHSYVTESYPEDQEEIAEPIKEIELVFNAGIESVSTASVFNEEGQEVEIANINVESPFLTLSLNDPLAPGTYLVEWRALGEDTHQTEGEFSFEVLPFEQAAPEEEVEEFNESVDEINQENIVNEDNTEIAIDQQEEVESSLGRMLWPLIITGVIALIFVGRFIIKRMF